MERSTKFIFLGGVALFIIAGVVIFFAFHQGAADAGSAGGGVGGGGTLPDTNFAGGTSNGGTAVNQPSIPLSEEEQKKLVQLSKDPVVGPTTNKTNDRVLFFKKGTGNLFQIPFDGSGGEERISNIIIKNISRAIWSPSKTYASIASIDSQEINNFWLHITSTSTVETGAYSSTLFDSVFSPEEEKLAFLTRAGSQYAISISSPDGRSPKNIFITNIPDFELSWPSKTMLALKTKTSITAPSLLETLSTATGATTVVSSGERALDTLWSPDGTHYLALFAPTAGPQVALQYRSLGTNENPANLTFKTLPEKCAFSKKQTSVFYCGVPRTLGQEGLPDAWWKGHTKFQDELWQINIQTGETKLLLSGGGFDITNVFTSANENYIFFVNKNDSTLWSLRLL